MSHVRILTSVAASVAYLGHQSRVITTGLKEHTAFSLPNWFKQPPVHSVPPKGVRFRAKWKSVFIEILATCPPYSETTVSTSSRKDSVGSSILFNGLLQALPQRAKKKKKKALVIHTKLRAGMLDHPIPQRRNVSLLPGEQPNCPWQRSPFPPSTQKQRSADPVIATVKLSVKGTTALASWHPT